MIFRRFLFPLLASRHIFAAAAAERFLGGTSVKVFTLSGQVACFGIVEESLAAIALMIAKVSFSLFVSHTKILMPHTSRSMLLHNAFGRRSRIISPFSL